MRHEEGYLRSRFPSAVRVVKWCLWGAAVGYLGQVLDGVSGV